MLTQEGEAEMNRIKNDEKVLEHAQLQLYRPERNLLKQASQRASVILRAARFSLAIAIDFEDLAQETAKPGKRF